MTVNDTTQHKGFTPEGCIATIPPQSVRSCELVIEALAQELEWVTRLLGSALETYIHEWDTPDEVRDACDYTQGWRDAYKLLAELREHWPHLNV